MSHAGNSPGLEAENELKRSGSFRQFALEPFEVRLLYQLHYGELSNGDSVVVKIVHADLEHETDLQLLGLLEPTLTLHFSDSDQFDNLVGDFRQSIAESLDCLITAEALQTLKHDSKGFVSLCIPQVYFELCSQRILVTERLGGRRLDKLIETASRNAGPFYDGATSVNGLIPDEISRLLCDVWLYLTFEGTLMPVDLQAHNIVIRSATQVAIVDGSFAVLLSSAKKNLRDYLIYAATDEPSRALDCLLKECDVSQQAISTANLDRQFRQTVAFRDGGWADEGQANTLAESIFAHWRLFTRHSIRPLTHLIGVCRGIFQATRLARQLSPERDSLLEGVKDLRLVKMLTDFRTALEPGYWGGQMDKVISLLMLGPKHLDDAILNASDQKETYERPKSNEDKSILKAIFAVLLLVVIYLFIRDYNLPQLITQVSSWIPALVMSICLAVLLRFISSGRKSS
jgi:predicted unusual protein kinase regulating ubiquinone biosynthesis (AarF/ABC1/UbiB family)